MIYCGGYIGASAKVERTTKSDLQRAETRQEVFRWHPKRRGVWRGDHTAEGVLGGTVEASIPLRVFYPAVSKNSARSVPTVSTR